MNHILLDGPQAINGLDFESLPKIVGDDRLSYEGAQLPKG